MDAASSTAADLATTTYLSASSTATATDSVASSFSWLSIKDVFLMVVLYMWYMFLFIACGAVILGGLWLAFYAVLAFCGYMCEHSPKMYESSKECVGKYWKSSKQTAPGAPDQNNEPQMGGVETEGKTEAESRMGTETV